MAHRVEGLNGKKGRIGKRDLEIEDPQLRPQGDDAEDSDRGEIEGVFLSATLHRTRPRPRASTPGDGRSPRRPRVAPYGTRAPSRGPFATPSGRNPMGLATHPEPYVGERFAYGVSGIGPRRGRGSRRDDRTGETGRHGWRGNPRQEHAGDGIVTAGLGGWKLNPPGAAFPRASGQTSAAERNRATSRMTGQVKTW